MRWLNEIRIRTVIAKETFDLYGAETATLWGIDEKRKDEYVKNEEYEQQ